MNKNERKEYRERQDRDENKNKRGEMIETMEEKELRGEAEGAE